MVPPHVAVRSEALDGAHDSLARAALRAILYVALQWEGAEEHLLGDA
jgi:hypothetical protein